MVRRSSLFVLPFLLVATTASADERVTDFQTWSQVQVTAPVDRDARVRITVESTVRRGSPGSVDPDTGAMHEDGATYLFVRPSIGIAVLPHLELALGYAFAPVFYDGQAHEDVMEQRVWEQAVTSHSVGRVKLSTRSRLEERMRSRGQGHGDTELRLRERLRLTVDLGASREVAWVASDEVLVFLNRTDFESRPGFSENRAFTGIAYRIDPRATVEVGYLHQFVGGGLGTHRSNHVLSTSFSFALGRRTT